MKKKPKISLTPRQIKKYEAVAWRRFVWLDGDIEYYPPKHSKKIKNKL